MYRLKRNFPSVLTLSGSVRRFFGHVFGPKNESLLFLSIFTISRISRILFHNLCPLSNDLLIIYK